MSEETTPSAEEQRDSLLEILDKLPPSEVQQRLRQIVQSGKVREFLYADETNLAPVLASLNIMCRWRPQIDHEGYVVGPAEGDMDNIDELHGDAFYLASLNGDIGRIKGESKVRAQAAELELKHVQARLRREIRAKGPSGRALSDQRAKDLVMSHNHYEEAFKIWITAAELAEVIESHYFSAQRLIDQLNERVKSLVSKWGRDHVDPPRNTGEKR